MKAEEVFSGSGFRVPHLRKIVGSFSSHLTGLFDRDNRQTESVGLLAWAKAHLPEHFTLPPSRMHVWLDEQLSTADHVRGTKINLVGPRGGAKSTVGTLAYILRCALEQREAFIWIVSDTRHQACAHLDNIKTELLENESLASRFPDAAGRGPVWRQNQVVLQNGIAIEAYGTGQSIRGRRRRADRPTLIVCDDLQSDSHALSADLRESSRQWFHGTLMKAGTRRTNVVHLATALHRNALALELHRSPGWVSRIFPVIEEWPARMELWAEWESIYCDVETPASRERAKEFFESRRAEMTAGSKLLWAEAEDIYSLMCMRVEGGRIAFEREKQGAPVNPRQCEFPEEYFNDQIWFQNWPHDLEMKVIALDPSKGGQSRRSDYSAFVLLGVGSDGLLYAEADLARRPTPRIVSDGVNWIQTFRPDVFGTETNQFQELLQNELEEALRQEGLHGVAMCGIENRVNKEVRIRRLGPYLSKRRLRFNANSPSTRLLVDQLKDFPVGDHDDGPDALEMAIRLAAEFTQGSHEDGLGGNLLFHDA